MHSKFWEKIKQHLHIKVENLPTSLLITSLLTKRTECKIMPSNLKALFCWDVNGRQFNLYFVTITARLLDNRQHFKKQ